MNLLVKSISLVVLSGVFMQVSAVKLELTPTISKKITNKDTTLRDNKVMLGIRGTAYLNDNVGIQLGVESSNNNRTLGVGGGYGKTDIERGTVNAIYEVSGKRVRPYGLVGIGYERTHDDNVNTVTNNNDDSQVFYNAGAGVKFGINDNVDIVTEVKAIHKVENSDDDIMGTVGVGIKFGETNQKEPTCASPKALSLDQFAKMCKTPATQPVAKVQQTQPMAVQKEIPVQQPVAQPVLQEAQPADNCVVEVESDEGSVEVSEDNVVPQGYYVQLAALFKGNGEILTNRLERKNYPYILHNAKRFGKDATLVLVGPYQSKKEAKIAQRYLKRLSRKAFIKRFP